jgi:hypothetical protein
MIKLVMLTLGSLLLGAMTLAAQEECQPVFNALDKVMSTPTRILSTTTAGGKPKTTETIYADKAIFTSINGKWTRSPASLEKVQQQEKDGRKTTVYACSHVKDEEGSGEASQIYSVSAKPVSGPKTESQFWISKSTGLPLRNEVDVERSGKEAKSHYSVRYEYKNVAAPKVD